MGLPSDAAETDNAPTKVTTTESRKGSMVEAVDRLRKRYNLSLGARMIFVWDEVNDAEIRAHGVDRATAEAVFFTPDAGIRCHPTIPNRWAIEGTVDGKLYRVPFSKTFPDGIRITTAFRISRKRRLT
jgi:uncharacterized DUF497 family protein